MTVLTTHQEFEALRAEWDDLWSRTPEASAFQSHAWTSSWARQYVADGRLRVVVVREAGRLVAGVALYVERRGLFRALAPLGGVITDVTDVLVDPSAPQGAARLAQAVVAVPGWDSVDLPEVPPHGLARVLADVWQGRTWSATSSLSLELPVLPLEDLLGRIPSRTAGTLRRKNRKIGALGLERTEVTEARDVARSVDDLVDLHRQQWAGRGGNPEHLTARFRDHLVSSLERMVPAGAAVLVEYRAAGELMASQIDVVDTRAVSYYLAGISPALRGQVDTAVLLATCDLELARRLGAGRYSMLRGREDYKLRWRPEEVWAHRVVLTRPSSVRGRSHRVSVMARHAALQRARPALREGRRRLLALRAHPRVVALRRGSTGNGA